MSFTGFAFYIAVRCGVDKHLYLTSCLNAHNYNTCIRLPQTGCTARKMALFIISQDRQTQDLHALQGVQVSRAKTRLGAESPLFSMLTYRTSFCFGCNNRTVPV